MGKYLITACQDHADLLDRIYESAALPDLWPGVLDRAGAIPGMDGAILFAVKSNLTTWRWIATERTKQLCTGFVDEGWMERNSRAAKLGPMRYPGFVGDLDLFTREQMDADPFYTELLRPCGLGWGAGRSSSRRARTFSSSR